MLLRTRRCEDHDMSDPFVNVIRHPKAARMSTLAAGLSP